MKRFLAIFLALCMLFTCTAAALSVTAAAQDAGFTYNVLSNGTVSLSGYTGNASKLTIPAELDGKRVTAIGFRAFARCDSLTSVIIPDSVTDISAMAFVYCKSLTSVTIPDSVTSIGNRAFYKCDNLTSVTIPDSVTSIGDEAFAYCKSLTSITIPDSVTSIGDDAFLECNAVIHRVSSASSSQDAQGWTWDKQSIDPNSAVLPDLGIFLQCNKSEEHSDLVSYSFDLDEGESIIDDILLLLLEPEYQLSFSRRTEYDFISSSGLLCENYYYNYTGDASVGQYTDTLDKLTGNVISGNVVLSVNYYYAQGRIGLTLYFGSGFTIVDPGKQLENPPTDFSGKSTGSSGGNSLFEDCDICDGDGRCNTCGGSGKVTKWVGDQYMTVTCTEFFCRNGTCTACNGSGHK